MVSSLINPFARTMDTVDEVDSISVPDFDVYQNNASGRIQLVSDALSSSERELLRAGDGVPHCLHRAAFCDTE
jgi:hypothetical protein